MVATLIHKAIGDQLECVFVDNGLLRKNEFEDVLHLYTRDLHLPVRGVDATDLFMERLSGVSDPEKSAKLLALALSMCLSKKSALILISNIWHRAHSIRM